MQCPDDYRLWLQTMYALFGTKWAKIYCGPMWSVAQTDSVATRSRNKLQPTEVQIQVHMKVLTMIIMLLSSLLGTSKCSRKDVASKYSRKRHIYVLRIASKHTYIIIVCVLLIQHPSCHYTHAHTHTHTHKIGTWYSYQWSYVLY